MAEVEITLSDADLDRLAERIAARMQPTPASSASEKLLWTEEEAARAVGVSKHSLKRWREAGCFASHTTTRPILYTRDQLAVIVEWMGRNERPAR